MSQREKLDAESLRTSSNSAAIIEFQVIAAPGEFQSGSGQGLHLSVTGEKAGQAISRGLGAKLVTLRDTPHAIAGGVAIGVFIGFTPLFGIKTLLSLGAAYLLRCNPIAAVIAVSLHDVVTPHLAGPSAH